MHKIVKNITAASGFIIKSGHSEIKSEVLNMTLSRIGII